MTRLVCRSSNVLLLFNDVLLGGYGSCSRVLVFVGRQPQPALDATAAGALAGYTHP